VAGRGSGGAGNSSQIPARAGRVKVLQLRAGSGEKISILPGLLIAKQAGEIVGSDSVENF